VLAVWAHLRQHKDEPVFVLDEIKGMNVIPPMSIVSNDLIDQEIKYRRRPDESQRRAKELLASPHREAG